MRIIFQKGRYRIVEHHDSQTCTEDLMGDCYDPVHNPAIPIEQLEQEKTEFLKTIDELGVFGFELEVWNPEINRGWEHVTSCWGFIGAYDETDEDLNHYIVDEMKERIERES